MGKITEHELSQELVDQINQTSSTQRVSETFVATEGQTVFTLSSYTFIKGVGRTEVFTNGVQQSLKAGHYTEGNDGKTITLQSPQKAGTLVEVLAIIGALPVGNADGNNEDLLTDDKSTKVAAINEVYLKVVSISGTISIEAFPRESGEDNDSPRIARALDYASKNYKAAVKFDNKLYTLKEPVTIPENVKILGADRPNFKWRQTYNQIGGTWIVADVSVNSNVFIMKSGSAIDNLGFYYPGQDYNKWSSTTEQYPGETFTLFKPVEFSPTVTLFDYGSGTVDDISIERCTFINSYEAIDFSNVKHRRHKIRDNRITPINKCITIGDCVDVGVIKDIHIYPFWTEDTYSAGGYKVNQYAEAKCTAIEIGGSDAQEIHGVSVVGANESLLFSDAGGSGTQGTQVSQFKMDLCFKGITVNSGSYIDIIDSYLVPIEPMKWKDINNQRTVTDGSCYGIKVNNGGYVTIDNCNMLRVDGIGLWITKADFKVNAKNVNINNCSYKGVVAKADSGYIYRLSLSGVSVHCSETTTVPYEFNKLNQSKVTDIVWLGETPTTKVTNPNNHILSELDMRSLNGVEEHWINGVKQQVEATFKINVSTTGAVTATSLTQGISAPTISNSADANLKYFGFGSRTAVSVIGERNGQGAGLNACAVVTDVNNPNAFRFYNYLTESIVPSTDSSVTNKYYLIKVLFSN